MKSILKGSLDLVNVLNPITPRRAIIGFSTSTGSKNAQLYSLKVFSAIQSLFAHDIYYYYAKFPISFQFTDGCRYLAPTQPGFSTEMKESSRLAHSFPDGDVWRSLREQEQPENE